MKKIIHNTTLMSLITATAGLGFVTAPLATAQGSTKPGTNQGARQDISNVERTPLTSEVAETFVVGYTIPSQYRNYFTEFPKVDQENVVIRYHKSRAYYVNREDWKIVRVVELDSTVEVGQEDTVLVEGYVIPESRRSNFVDVPMPEEAQHVRYYNNTAYYMDSNFKIVRTVRLKS